MPKYIITILLVTFCFGLTAFEWPNAVPIRQGVNIEWFRSGTDTPDGGAIYVWSDTKLGARDLYAQKVDASGNMVWGQPLLVDGKIDRQEDPVITKTSDGNYIIAWIDFSDDLDGNVYAQKINDNGQLLWQTGGVPVCVYPQIQISLNMEADNEGGAYIIWEDSRNPGKDIYGQRLSSTGAPLWTVNGIPIANEVGADESYNTMWPDGAGGMIVGYVRAQGASENLLIKRFLPDGQMAWTQPLALSPNDAKQNKIKMAPINNDSFVFTWMDFRNIHPDIYAQRVSISGDVLWPDPFIVYSDDAAPTPAPQENPRIVQTSDNGVIIIWEDKRNGFDNSDLYAQKLSLTGQRLWDVNGVPLAIADFNQNSPRMSRDNDGGCYVVWDDSRNGNAPQIDIYAQHLSSTGASLWSANGLAICTAPNEQSSSLLKAAGNNVFINWMDMRNGSVGIYYQVVSSAGVPLLAENGVEVFWGLSGDATLKDIIMLPRQNDVVVVWQDTRFANLGYQIYYQIVNSDSSVAFEENGRPVTILTGRDQQSVSAVVLPDDKIAIVWEENRTNNPKIFGQLLDSNGNRLWGDMGIAMTDSEPLRQKDPRISYQDGALYVGWSNLDSVTSGGNNYQLFHIYGQKIVGNTKMWGNDGVLISEIPPENVLFECELGELLETTYVWTRTSIHPDDTGAKTVWAKRMNPDGTTSDGWNPYGVLTSNYTGWDLIQYKPEAALTHDGVFVIWQDFRDDYIKNLYGQFISNSGQIMWDPSGVNLVDYGREQDEISLLGGNDITFAWKESVTGNNEDIMIQRYSTGGMPLWGPLGMFVVERDTTQASPFLARFPNGGMVIAWEDYADEDADIYIRYIESDGTLVGSNQGIVVCDEIMPQQYAQIAVLKNELPAKAIIIWSDGRSSGKTPIFGIYAQKINNQTTSLNDNTVNPAIPYVTLRQNYPNPFNPETKISFSLAKDTDNLELAIYNLKGQKVKVLYQGKTEKGTHSAVWEGKDENNNDVASGVYFYRLTTDSRTISRKMVLMK